MGATKKASPQVSRSECLPNRKLGAKKAPSEEGCRPVGAPAKGRESEEKSSKDEIEDIFAKRRRKGKGEGRAVDPDERARPPLPKKKKTGEKLGSRGKEGQRTEASDGGKARKKTADGLSIYGEDELKWNSKSAGGTALCPFDCSCCF